MLYKTVTSLFKNPLHYSYHRIVLPILPVYSTLLIFHLVETISMYHRKQCNMDQSRGNSNMHGLSVEVPQLTTLRPTGHNQEMHADITGGTSVFTTLQIPKEDKELPPGAFFSLSGLHLPPCEIKL